MPEYHAVSGSAAEDLFIELFSDALGAERGKRRIPILTVSFLRHLSKQPLC